MKIMDCLIDTSWYGAELYYTADGRWYAIVRGDVGGWPARMTMDEAYRDVVQAAIELGWIEACAV